MKILKLLAGLISAVAITGAGADEPPAWERFRGQAGSSGWRCHVIHPDPTDDGPDGINFHDWNADGLPDLLSNAEEGGYSRLYFHPGLSHVREVWSDYIEFRHGKCEDSGIGDLDDDGDIDYIANGGWVYFNPGADQVREATAWERMTLFDYERRVPTVADVDGDGLQDLIVGAQEWYRQPQTGKHRAENWTRYHVGKNRWPMNCILHDVDGDGDVDWVVPDRGREICWYENPGQPLHRPAWQRHTLHPHTEPMFMTVADVNHDLRSDFVIAGGNLGDFQQQLLVLLRTNTTGHPQVQQIAIDQPCGLFPKGVAVLDLDGNGVSQEILVIPKSGDLWTATFVGDALRPDAWRGTPLPMPGAHTRLKMDNAWLCDIDLDGDVDVATTEENGGWGIVWFENPHTR